MKILARIVMVLLLLSGLGYGSYAFGKYVLSNKLFGNGTASGLRTVSRATGQASAVTHHTDWKGAKPRVEVKVLPSDEDGAPTIVSSDDDSSSSHHTSTPDTSSSDNNHDASTDDSGVSKNGKRNLDDAPIEYSMGNKDGSDSSRRHRRHRKDKGETASATARVEATQDNPTAPEGDGASASASTSEAASHDGDHSSISVAADDSVVKAPRAQSTSDTTSTPEAKPTHRSRHHRDRTRSEHSRGASPVPQPETSAPTTHEKSGGDKADISPVPQPE